MKYRLTMLLGSALLLFGQAARADVSWSYDWSFDKAGDVNDRYITTGAHSQLHMKTDGEIPLTATPALPGTDVVAAHVGYTFTKLPAGAIDYFDGKPGHGAPVPYTLSMDVVDKATGADHVFTISGMISGTLAYDKAVTMNTFNTPTDFGWVTIGKNQYHFFLTNFTGTGPQGGLAGVIGGHVDVRPGTGGPNDSPEPSTMVLSCLGLAATGLAGWRRRRAA